MHVKIFPKTYHVIPEGDLVKHETNPQCWCGPTKDPGYEVWVHHSADGREEDEVEIERLTSNKTLCS